MRTREEVESYFSYQPETPEHAARVEELAGPLHTLFERMENVRPTTLGAWCDDVKALALRVFAELPSTPDRAVALRALWNVKNAGEICAEIHASGGNSRALRVDMLPAINEFIFNISRATRT